MTLKELADKLGASEATVSRLERAQTAISTDWLERIADALDTPIADLIGQNFVGQFLASGDVFADGVFEYRPQLILDVLELAKANFSIRLAEDIPPFSKGDYLIARPIPDGGETDGASLFLGRHRTGYVYLGRFSQEEAFDALAQGVVFAPLQEDLGAHPVEDFTEFARIVLCVTVLEKAEEPLPSL